MAVRLVQTSDFGRSAISRPQGVTYKVEPRRRANCACRRASG